MSVGQRRSGGFSFIELMMTLSLMAVLATVSVPLMQLSAQRDKERELRAALVEIRTAIDSYKRAADAGRIQVRVGESGYPKSLLDLVTGVEDIRNPKHANLYFLRRLPRDPFHSRDDVAPEETWGLRSYSSPPDDPREGEDVFDIHSMSDGVGLNGIPYNQW